MTRNKTHQRGITVEDSTRCVHKSSKIKPQYNSAINNLRASKYINNHT